MKERDGGGMLRRRLGQTSELRRSILRLAWPTITEQMLITLVGTVSTIMVASIGNEAISAVGMVNSFINVLQAILAALSTGITVLVARLTGERDYAQAQRSMHQALLIALIAAGFITVAVGLFTRELIMLFMGGADIGVIDLAEHYFKIVLWSFPLFIINLVLAGSFRGAGNMRLPMMVAILSNFVNIALGFALIYGVGPIPAMGITGAAWAVMIARAVSGIVILGATFLGRSRVHIALQDFFRFYPHIVKRIFRIGIPASVEQMTMAGGGLLMQMIVALMGTFAMAGYQVLNSIHTLVMTPLFGLGITVTTIVGQSLGAKDVRRARANVYQTIGIAYIFSIISFLLLMFGSAPLASIFTRDIELVAKISDSCRILAGVEMIMPLICIISNSLRGSGDIKYVTASNIIGIAIIRVSLTYIFFRFFGMGLEAVFWAFLIDSSVRGTLYALRLRGDTWTKKVV